MYNLTIHFGPNAVAWSFLFKDKDKAISAITAAKNRQTIIDDYEQYAEIAGEIHGILLEDLETGEEARIIRGLTQARGQMRANKRAQNDPEIQALQRESQRGPGVITPFTNGGFRPQ